MRKYQPALVDWPAIKARIEAGEGFTSVAKDYEITRQAIQKRCKREGWLKGKDRTMAVRREKFKRNQALQPSATLQPETQPQPVVVAQPSAFVVDQADKRSAALELLRDGVPRKHAAQSVGIGETTLLRWINEDDGFGAEVRAAESAAVALRVRRIGRAGERDWRADSWFLERTQRDSFGSDNAKGGAVNVQINIERDAKGTEPVRIESID